MAWLPAGFPGEARIFGRGEALASDAHPRLTFVRQLPSGPEAVPPFSLPTLSRVQLVASACGVDSVRLRNVGRCRLFVAGKAVQEASLAPGRVAQLGQKLLLLCVCRSVTLATPPQTYPSGPFGEADGLGIVGESPAIWMLRQQLGLIGPRSGHVLLLGPSGSGKELSARGVHALSGRRGRPLIARSAATIPETLIDAELFGNAKNYPNHGMPERLGLVGQADQSTLFLDEVAELSPAMQGHLLRVLDQGEYHRLGESVARCSNLRLVAATHRPVSELRADLLARFAFRMEIPDLNARREDIPLLVRHLLRRFAETDGKQEPEGSIEFWPELLEHPYTTHLRELERLLLRRLVGGGHTALDETSDDAGDTARPAVDLAADPDDQGDARLTPKRIQAALDAHNGSIEAAFRALGLKNRFALRRLIAKHHLEVRRMPSPKRAVQKAGGTKR